MPTPNDAVLYAQVKKEADEKYGKATNAYKNGWLVKTYKDRGGTYSGRKSKQEGLTRWYAEQWKDIGNQEYPVYRPTKRINEKTPITADEIDPKNLRDQIALKQIIKGDARLPPFIPKRFS